MEPDTTHTPALRPRHDRVTATSNSVAAADLLFVPLGAEDTAIAQHDPFVRFSVTRQLQNQITARTT